MNPKNTPPNEGAQPWPPPDGVPKAAFDDVTPLVGQFAALAEDTMAGIERRRAWLTPAFAASLDARRFAAKRALVSLEAEGVAREDLAALARVARWAEEGGPAPLEEDLDAAEPLIMRLVDRYVPQSSPGPMRADLRAADAAVPDLARTWMGAVDGL